MKRVASSAILILVITCSAFAQTASDAAGLTRLLNEFLAGASRGDAAIHERFWADDLIYTRSAGRRVNKSDVMRDVRSAPAPSRRTRKPFTPPRTLRFNNTATRRSLLFDLFQPRMLPALNKWPISKQRNIRET